MRLYVSEANDTRPWPAAELLPAVVVVFITLIPLFIIGQGAALITYCLWCAGIFCTYRGIVKGRRWADLTGAILFGSAILAFLAQIPLVAYVAAKDPTVFDVHSPSSSESLVVRIGGLIFGVFIYIEYVISPFRAFLLWSVQVCTGTRQDEGSIGNDS